MSGVCSSAEPGFFEGLNIIPNTSYIKLPSACMETDGKRDIGILATNINGMTCSACL